MSKYVSYSTCRNFSRSLSSHSILLYVSFVRHVHRPADLARTGLHGSTLKIVKSFWEISRNHLSSYPLLIFLMRPTNSKALEVTEKLSLIFHGPWVRPYLGLVTFLKECAVKLTCIHHITMLAYKEMAEE